MPLQLDLSELFGKKVKMAYKSKLGQSHERKDSSFVGASQTSTDAGSFIISESCRIEQSDQYRCSLPSTELDLLNSKMLTNNNEQNQQNN
jgi:hypothetical protein